MTTVGYGDISAYNTQARVHIHKSHCYFVLFIANIGDGNLYDSSAGWCDVVWLLPWGCCIYID